MTLPVPHVTGCLLGTMTGDSLGVVLNGTDPGPLRHRYPDEGALLRLRPGSYGAATEMTWAVATSLASFPSFNGPDVARLLAETCTAERGYGQGTWTALERLRLGRPWREAGLGSGGRSCFGNGAATRSAPVGLLYADDAELLRWTAEEIAAITHQHALGAEGAAMQALAVGLALRSRGRPLDAAAFLDALAGECRVREFRVRYEVAATMASRGRVDVARVVARLGNNETALGSVVTAAFCFARHPDAFDRAVAAALRLGGNTAAIAAMTGAISGTYLGEEAIPRRWLEPLESRNSDPLSPERFRELGRKLAVVDVE
jgi:poly(ADP-ribose) glycohydrolase ARH3